MNQFQELEIIANSLPPGSSLEMTPDGFQIRSSHAPDPATAPRLDADGDPMLDDNGNPIVDTLPWIMDGLETLDSYKQRTGVV